MAISGKQIKINSIVLNRLSGGTKILPDSALLGSNKTPSQITDNREFTTKEYVDINSVNDLQSAYDESSDPEIILNTSGLTVRDGTSSLVNGLFEVQSNDGSTSFLNVNTTGLSSLADIDATYDFGNVKLSYINTDEAVFSHFDHLSSTNFALKQDNSGNTILNAPTGSNVNININNSNIISAEDNFLTVTTDVDFTSTGYLNLPSGTYAERPAGTDGILRHNSEQHWLEYYNTRFYVPLIGTNCLHFSLVGQASSTYGELTKASDIDYTGQNPSGVSTTSRNIDYLNQNLDPYLMIENGKFTKITIKYSKVAVGTPSVGSNPTTRINIYREENTSRTLLASADVPIDDTSNVGQSNDLSGNNFQANSLLIDVDFNEGDLIGVEFQNRNTTNNEVNAVKMLNVSLEYIKR